MPSGYEEAGEIDVPALPFLQYGDAAAAVANRFSLSGTLENHC